MTPAESMPTRGSSRPSITLVVLSVLMLLGSAGVAGFAAAQPFRISTTLFISLCFIAVSCFLGVNQFLGTFRRWPTSALVTGLVQLLLGAAWLSLLLVMQPPPSVPVDYVEVSTWVVVGVFLLSTGILNLLWRIRLIRLVPPSEPAPLARFSFHELFLLMIALGVGVASTVYQLQPPPYWGEDVQPARARHDVPAEAQRVCFSRTKGARAVEFTLDEAGFRRWVREGHPRDDRWQAPLEPISTVYKITRFWKGNSPPAVRPTVKINRGLYLEVKGPGRSLQVAYDEEAGRVYLYETWLVYYDK